MVVSMRKTWLTFGLAVCAVVLAALVVACDNDDGNEDEATSTAPPETMQVTLYYGNQQQDPDRPDCSVVFPTQREVPSSENVEEAALSALFAGPTAQEAADGFVSQFSSATASILIGVQIEGDTAYVNLTDFRSIISGASSSCGSATFFAEIESTLQDVASFQRVIYAIDGDPAPFYEFMQRLCDETNDNCDPTPFQQNAGE
jgi:spore germination protein GerM